MAGSLDIVVWSKDYVRLGSVGGPFEVHCTPRFNAPGDATFSVAADHPRLADLMTPGCRCVFHYTPDGGTRFEVYSGRITERTGEGLAAAAVRTFIVLDDFVPVLGLVGYVNPTGDDDEQGHLDEDHHTYIGSPEKVIKDSVGDNATRVGMNLIIPPNEDRGTTGFVVSVRMLPLRDVLFPGAEVRGIGVRVIQFDDERTLDVFEPAVHARPLTEESGVIVGGTWQIVDATINRTMIGAGGAGYLRQFKHYTVPDLITALGETLETFVDARDIDNEALDYNIQMGARAGDEFANGQGKTSMSFTLAEGRVFRYGIAFQLGDKVSIQPAGGPLLTDYIREVAIDYTSSDGLVVTPKIGDWTDSPDSKLYARVVKLAAGLRKLQGS